MSFNGFPMFVGEIGKLFASRKKNRTWISTLKFIGIAYGLDFFD